MVAKLVRLNSKRVVVLLALVIALIAQSFVMAQTRVPEVEIVGVVSAMTNASITVGTQVFDTSKAEIKSGVEIGATVKVHAVENATGEWVAREVELAIIQTPTAESTSSPESTPSPDVTATPMPVNAFEITGEITAMTATTIDVGGHTIDISNAEIKNSLAVGDRVKVHVIVLNGQWIAREVESAAVEVTVTVPANCTPAQPAGWVTYTIQAGDTLSSIAFGSGSSVQDIATANCITNASSIQVGQTIFVPKQPILVPGNNGNGNDDGVNHDQNDDHGGSNSGSDDSGNHSGSDDHHSDDNGSGGHGSDDGGNSGSGSSGSGEGSGHG